MAVTPPDLHTLARLRADAGDGEAKVYSDADLIAIWHEPRVGGDYTRAVATAIWRLVTNVALFNRYMGGASPEQRAAQHKMLTANYKLWTGANQPAATMPRVQQGGVRYAGPTVAGEW